MAWFSSRTKPFAQESGKKGRKHSMLNYSSTVYEQSHMNQTERIFLFGHVNDDHHRVYSPPQINLLKDYEDDINMYSHLPSIVAHGLPKKGEGFSPKESLKGVPGYKNHSTFSWDDDDHRTDDSDDENYDRHGGYGGSYLPKPVHTKPEYDTDYGMESPKGAHRKPSFVPPPGRHQQYTVPVSTSPKKDTYHELTRNRPIGHSPPRRKPETETQSQKTGWKPLFEPARHPQYSAPVSTSPNIDAYHETARNMPIGHSPPQRKPESETQSQKTGWKPLFEPARHPQYSAPVSTSPNINAYHETARSRPIGHNPPLRKPETDTQSQKTGWKPSFEPARHPQYSAPVSTSTTTRNRPIGLSPPRSKPESDTQSPKAGWKPLFEPPPGTHPLYSSSIPTSPKKETHYETANNRPIVPGSPRSKPESVSDYAVESPKDGKQTSFVRPTGKHPHYYAPDTTPPKKDTHNDTANNRPKNSKPVQDNGKVSAHVMTQPRKEDHQQTIDSSEARKRYGGKAVNQPVPEEEYVGTIDCREAARKYNGIFVP